MFSVASGRTPDPSPAVRGGPGVERTAWRVMTHQRAGRGLVVRRPEMPQDLASSRVPLDGPFVVNPNPSIHMRALQ